MSVELFANTIERQPIFDFKISKEDFYINTHGVSVVENIKSETDINSGNFYFLNRLNKPIYFGELTLKNINMRNETAFLSTSVSHKLTKTEILNKTLQQEYTIYFRESEVGVLKIIRPIAYDDNSNTTITPFQSIKFTASYSVLNLNRLDLHYYGKSNIKPNKTNGYFDINFDIICYGNQNRSQIINDVLTITVKVINTK